MQDFIHFDSQLHPAMGSVTQTEVSLLPPLQVLCLLLVRRPWLSCQMHNKYGEWPHLGPSWT